VSLKATKIIAQGETLGLDPPNDHDAEGVEHFA
jgi:hypothetical protein